MTHSVPLIVKLVSVAVKPPPRRPRHLPSAWRADPPAQPTPISFATMTNSRRNGQPMTAPLPEAPIRGGITVSDVSMVYRSRGFETVALDRCSFHFDEGQRACLIG